MSKIYDPNFIPQILSSGGFFSSSPAAVVEVLITNAGPASFDPVSSVAVLWEFGDGEPDVDSTAPAHSYAVPATYIAKILDTGSNPISAIVTLNMSNDDITALGGLNFLTNLTFLTMTNNDLLPSLAFVPGDLPSIETLTLGSSEILASITGLTNLTTLLSLTTSVLPVIESLDVTGLSSLSSFNGANSPLLDTVTLPVDGGVIISCRFQNCALPTAQLDAIASALNTNNEINGTLKIEGGSMGIITDGALNSDIVDLVADGWLVTLNT